MVASIIKIEAQMFALQVRVNDDEPIICGAEDLGVITANVTGLGRLGPSSQQVRNDETTHFFVQAGGLTARGPDTENEHVYWLPQRDLKLGDKVTIQIVEVESANPIAKSSVAKKKDSPK